MLCNCQALVMGGRYRCCSKVEGCSSADDFDYYQGTPSVKGVCTHRDLRICGVQVLDVDLGPVNPSRQFDCMYKGYEYDCFQKVDGSSYDCYGEGDNWPTMWRSCETGCVPT